MNGVWHFPAGWRRKQSRIFEASLGVGGLVLGGLVGIAFLDWDDPTLRDIQGALRAPFGASAEPSAASPRPNHGWVNAERPWEHVSPFTIITPSGSDHYYVELLDELSGEVRMGVFVEAGRTLNTKAPLGVYKVRWSAGENWRNTEDKFGWMAGSFQALRPFEFRSDRGNTIDLNLYIEGNMQFERTFDGR